ncbi:MAG TPA: hypothetical protein VGG59_03705 [Acidobacteriaceae bacterium]|jgi:hypothetical protein
MSDFLATALGLAFTLVVCLLALQAILGPWLRRRVPKPDSGRADLKHVSHLQTRATQPDTTPVHTS